MNKKQYNNIIDWTVKHQQSAQAEDSLATARAIFDNMGVALPGGSTKEVLETLRTNSYMGWRLCTMEEAQAAADKGTAAIGISEDQIVVLAANDAEQPVEATATVMTLSGSDSTYSMSDWEYYKYRCCTTCYNCGADLDTDAHNLLEGIAKADIEDYFILSYGVDISSVDYRLLLRLYLMGKALGFSNIQIDSAYRSNEEQQRLYEAFLNGNGNPAAKPGESWHNWGGAVDVRSGAFTALPDSAFESFDLIRPVKSPQFEPWHIQVIETQGIPVDGRDDYFAEITKWSEVIC